MRHFILAAVLISLLVVGSCQYLANMLGGIETSLIAVGDSLQAEPTEVVISKKENMKTLNYSKIVDGVTYSMEAEWDCSPEALARITAAWQMLCDSIPDPESAAARGE